MNSTLVSLVPREIREQIPSLHPDWFCIPAAVLGIPQLLKIEPSFYYKPGLEGSSDRIEVPSIKVADEIVRKYNTSQVGYSENICPALFTISGDHDMKDVVLKFKDKIVEVKEKQKNWFLHLVKIADDDWVISHRHGVISDLQRSACRELKFNRDWLIEIPSADDSTCPACGSVLLKPDVSVCATCHSIINPKKFKELGFSQVGV